MDQKKWIAAKCYQCGKVVEEKNAFIVDEEKDLIFCSEECLYKHFAQPIIDLEKEFGATRSQQDILQSEFLKYEECLGALLEAPSEIWEDTETFPGLVLRVKEPKSAVLVFSSGNLVCTGTKSVDQVKKVVIETIFFTKDSGGGI